MASIDTLSIEIGANVKPAITELDKLHSKLEKVSTLLQTVSGLNLGNIASLGAVLDSMSTSLGSMSGTNAKAVASGIRSISKIDSAKLAQVAGGLTQISAAMATINGGGGGTAVQDLATTAASLSRFGYRTMNNAIANMQVLGPAVTNLLTQIASAPPIPPNTVAALTALSAGGFGGAGTITRGLSGTASGVAISGRSIAHGLASAFKGVLSAVKATANGIKTVFSVTVSGVRAISSMPGKIFSGITSGIRTVTSALTSLYFKFFAIKRILTAVSKLFTSSMNFIETYHYFDVAMGKIGAQNKDAWAANGYESADAYADSFAERSKELNTKMSGFVFDDKGFASNSGQKSLGMNPDMLMQYQAQYAQMADSIGMTGEAALATSKAMTMLAGDWSSLRNIGFDTSYQKMASALAGQSRAVRALGIDITQAALQQTAYNIGLTTSVSNMDQATKAELRMITILDQSRVAWGDLASTINTPANQLRMLQQNFISLGRTIGNLFLPIVEKVLPYINGLVIAMQRLFQWIAKMLGVDLKNTVTSSGGLNEDILGDLEDEANNATDAIDGTTDSAKKLKRTILGFDELNVLNDNSDTSSGSKAGSSGIAGLGAGEQALLDASLFDLLDEYEKVWNKAFEDMQSKAEEFAKKLEEIGRTIRNYIDRGFFNGLGKYFASGINSMLDKALEAFDSTKILSKIVPVINAITTTFNSLVAHTDFTKIGSLLADGVNIVFGAITTFVSGINWVNLGAQIANGFNTMLREVDWHKVGEGLTWRFRLAFGMLRGFIAEIDPKELGKSIAGIINGAVASLNWIEIGETLSEIPNKLFTTLETLVCGDEKGEGGIDWDKLTTDLVDGINTFIGGIEADDIAESMGKISSTISDAMYEMIEGINWTEIGSKFGRMLKGIDWKMQLKRVMASIKLILKGLVEGFGEEIFGDFGSGFLTGFIDGISGVIGLGELAVEGIALALGKLADAINLFDEDSGEILGTILGTIAGVTIAWGLGTKLISVSAGLLGIKTVATASAAAGVSGFGGALTTLSSGISNLFAAAGLGVVGSAAAVGYGLSRFAYLAKDIQEFMEVINGRNGVVTEIGTAWEETIRNMINAGVLIDDAGDDILNYIDELETQELSHDEISKRVIERLSEYGVSASQISDNVTESAKDTGYVIEEAANSITRNAGLAGDGWSEFATKFNVNGTSIENDAEAMRSLIHESLLGIDTSLTGNQRLWERLTEVVGTSAGSSQEKFQQFCNVLKQDFGFTEEQIDALIVKMGENFPEGVTKGTTQTQNRFSVMSAFLMSKMSGLGTTAQTTADSIANIGTESEGADKKSETLQDKMKKWTSPLSGILGTLFLGAVGGGVKTVGDNSDDADDKVDGLSGSINALLKDPGGTSHVATVASDISDVETNAVNATTEVGNFSTGIEEVDKDGTGKAAIEGVGETFTETGSKAAEAAEKINTKVGGLATKLGGHAVNLEAATKKDGLAVTEGLKNGINAGLHLLEGTVGDMWHTVSGGGQRYMAIMSPSKVMHQQGVYVMEGLINGIASKTSALDMTMKSIAYYIKSPFETITREIATLFSDLGSSIQRAAGNLYYVGSQMSYSLASGFQSHRIVLPHFGWNFNRITYGNGGFFDIPNIFVNWYAKGGLFTDPTIAGFGEGGPEAALPLTNKQTMRMISDSIVNSGGALSNGMDRNDVIEAVATGVAMAMGQNPQTVEVVVNSVLKTSDEKLAQSVSRGQARLNQRYNVAY